MVVRSRFFFLDYHFNPFVLSILPVVHEDLLKFATCHFSILLKKNKWYAKSIACHQFNLMKDKHTINLILISSKWVIPSFRVCSWWINSSSKCFHLFFSGVQISSAISSEPPYKSSQGSSYSFILHSISSPFFVTGVLHGGSSWFISFFKSSSRFCWRSSSIFSSHVF